MRIGERVAPAILAGAIALNTATVPLVVRADIVEDASDVVSQVYTAWGRFEDYYNYVDNWVYQHTFADLDNDIRDFWYMLTDLYLISKNAVASYRIPANGVPCKGAVFQTEDGEIHPVVVYNGEGLEQSGRKYFTVYTSPVFGEVIADFVTNAPYVQFSQVDTTVSHGYYYTPYGDYANITVSGGAWWIPSQYTITHRAQMSCHIAFSGEPPQITPEKFGLYFSPDNLSASPIGVVDRVVTLPAGNPSDPAGYYNSVIKPMFTDSPTVAPILGTVATDRDTPVFSAPFLPAVDDSGGTSGGISIPRFSVPLPDFGDYSENLSFWWAFTKKIIDETIGVKLVILAIVLALGVLIVTRIGGGF